MRANICYPFVLNPTGGSFESTKLLIEHLDTDRFDPTIVFGVDGSAATSSREAGVETDIVSLPHAVKERMRTDTGLMAELTLGVRLLPYIRTLRSYLLSNEVDLIHVNDGLAATIWGIAGKLTRTPIIWHVRSERPNVWDALRLRLVDQLIFVAESNKRKFASRSLNSIEITVIHNGVDTDRFRPGKSTGLHEELGLSTDTPLVGFVGNLVSRKRPMLFVRSGLKAIEEGSSAHFVLVGEDQGDFSRDIEQAVSMAGCEERFHLLGYRGDIPQIMQSLDLLVLTSTAHGEAFPRVPLEAMACGTPVISTDTAGVSEAVIDGKTGRIVDSGISPEELGALLNDTVSAEDELTRWAQSSIERAVAQFSADDHAEEIMEFYQSIL